MDLKQIRLWIVPKDFFKFKNLSLKIKNFLEITNRMINIINFYLQAIHFRRKPLPVQIAGTTFFLKFLPRKFRCFPRRWTSVIGRNLPKTICNWNGLIKLKASCRHSVYRNKIHNIFKAQWVLHRNQKFRPVHAFMNFHLICGPIMYSNSFITNWIWISIFTLQSSQCQSTKSVSWG